MNLATPFRAIPAVALTATLLAGVTGCSAFSAPSSTNGNASAGQPAKGSGTTLFDQLPADIRSAGQVTVAVDPTYPPFESLSADQKTVVGFDPDLLNNLAARIGIKIDWQRASFATIIPGLQASRYTMAISAMSDTPARQQQVSFVDYFTVLGAMVMPTSDPAGTKIPRTALCGKNVGVQSGSLQVSMSQAVSKTCVSEGKKPLNVMIFPSIPMSVLAQSSGRVDVVWTDSISAATEVSHSGGKLKLVVDANSTPTLGGIVFPKDQPQLASVFQQALQKAMDDGGYRSLMNKYGLTSSAIDKATINAGN